jgi:hypothetical protein
MKLLAGPHLATVSYRPVPYGKQEVRGSNPRSSTRRFLLDHDFGIGGSPPLADKRQRTRRVRGLPQARLPEEGELREKVMRPAPFVSAVGVNGDVLGS